MGTELWIYKMKRVPGMVGGDSCTTNVNVFKCHLKIVAMENFLLYVFPPHTHTCV